MQETVNEKINKIMIEYNNHLTGVNSAIDYIINNTELLTREEKIELFNRGLHHDESKVKNINEFKGYTKMVMELESVEYGSDEYNQIRKKYDYVIQEHYKNNRHHPEHHKNGIDDMTKIDIFEMLSDWIGAMIAKNSLDKSEQSLEINRQRYKISDDRWAEYKSILDELVNYFKNFKK